MSSVTDKPRRTSVSWIKTKLKSPIINNNKHNHNADGPPSQTSTKLNLPSHTVQQLPTTSPALHESLLLSLPTEIIQKIYDDFVLHSWTLAVFPPNTSKDILASDPTFNLAKSLKTKFLVSGPPGLCVLLVCRQLYHTLSSRYGSKFTGILNLGHVSGSTERQKLFSYLTTLPPPLSRFSNLVHTVQMSFAPQAVKSGLKFRAIFPNLCIGNIALHEGSSRPLLRLNDSAEGFLHGRDDGGLLRWTLSGVNHLIATDGKKAFPVPEQSYPWNHEGARIDVMLIGTVASDPYVRIGLHYSWAGGGFKVMSRLAFYGFHLKYWEDGMEMGDIKLLLLNNDEGRVPSKFRWILHRGDGSIVPIVRKNVAARADGIVLRM